MKFLFSMAIAACLAAPVFADDMKLIIDDPYARASSPVAKAGAAFMTITNVSDTDDRLLAASTDAAQRVELHTHLEDDAGVMRMREVENGFVIPAGESIALDRGGDHVMMMGLTQPFVHGQSIEVTLTFEQAGDLVVDIPIDLKRSADHAGHNNEHSDHSGHKH